MAPRCALCALRLNAAHRTHRRARGGRREGSTTNDRHLRSRTTRGRFLWRLALRPAVECCTPNSSQSARRRQRNTQEPTHRPHRLAFGAAPPPRSRPGFSSFQPTACGGLYVLCALRGEMLCAVSPSPSLQVDGQSEHEVEEREDEACDGQPAVHSDGDAPQRGDLLLQAGNSRGQNQEHERGEPEPHDDRKRSERRAIAERS